MVAPLNAALMGTLGLRAIGKEGLNPLKVMGNAPFLVSMGSDPTTRLKMFGEARNMILSPQRAASLKKTSQSHEKWASPLFDLLRGMRTPLQRVGDFARKYPIAAPLIGVGGAMGLLGGVDFLANQANVISRAKAYQGMMREYGEELKYIRQTASEKLGPEGESMIPESRVHLAFNALYQVAPDVAKDPTLAASVMVPLIRNMAVSSTAVPEAPGRAMLESPDLYNYPSTIQRNIPIRRRPSDLVTGGAKIVDTAMRLPESFEAPKSGSSFIGSLFG
jgi:hypothetical protein